RITKKKNQQTRKRVREATIKEDYFIGIVFDSNFVTQVSNKETADKMTIKRTIYNENKKRGLKSISGRRKNSGQSVRTTK
ncbi:hypothetical protein, partial [Porphyromonas macacae]|uniref:hypothetical protein n=1 Tax=Porphyromonas macacae TaxID=28115 RepID=UPI001EE343D3